VRLYGSLRQEKTGRRNYCEQIIVAFPWPRARLSTTRERPVRRRYPDVPIPDDAGGGIAQNAHFDRRPSSPRKPN
jgi:hypothetical protein